MSRFLGPLPAERPVPDRRLLFICDNEVAWLLENHFHSNGRDQIGLSIETYRFEQNGDLTIRTYYKVPHHDEQEIGEMFQTYLPENG